MPASSTATAPNPARLSCPPSHNWSGAGSASRPGTRKQRVATATRSGVAWQSRPTRAERSRSSRALPAAFVEDARQILLEQRAFRVAQLARLDLTPGSTFDGSFDAARGQVDAMLREAAQRVLTLVDAALLRIEQGTFGRCSSCGDLIPQHRLAALPMSTWCEPCHRTKELVGVGSHQATSQVG